MGFYSPEKISITASELGEKKAKLPLLPMVILGFLAGSFVGFGNLLMIRVTGSLPTEWGSLKDFCTVKY